MSGGRLGRIAGRLGWVALGAAVASVGWVGFGEVALSQVETPLVELVPEATPPYRITGSRTQSFSRLLGRRFGSSAAWSAAESLPLDPVHATVDLRAGSLVLPALVDTGAELAALPWTTLPLLGIPERVPVDAGRGAVAGVNGEGAARLVSLADLGLGPHRLGETLFVVSGDSPRLAPAVLGGNVFAAVVLTLDFAAGVLTVSFQPLADGVAWVGGARTPVVPARVGGVAVEAQIDTGADGTAVSTCVVERLGLPERTDLRASVTGATGATTRAAMVDLPAVGIAGVELPAGPARVAPDGAVPGMGDCWVNVGRDRLAGARLTVDFPSRRVALAR